MPYLCADQKSKEKPGKSENRGRVKTRATVKQCTPASTDTTDKVSKLDNCSEDADSRQQTEPTVFWTCYSNRLVATRHT